MLDELHLCDFSHFFEFYFIADDNKKGMKRLLTSRFIVRYHSLVATGSTDGKVIFLDGRPQRGLQMLGVVEVEGEVIAMEFFRSEEEAELLISTADGFLHRICAPPLSDEPVPNFFLSPSQAKHTAIKLPSPAIAIRATGAEGLKPKQEVHRLSVVVELVGRKDAEVWVLPNFDDLFSRDDKDKTIVSAEVRNYCYVLPYLLLSALSVDFVSLSIPEELKRFAVVDERPSRLLGTSQAGYGCCYGFFAPTGCDSIR